ncbi:hypothetical protein [Lentibacillus sediminis]|uniref:hypothetical protein n=1 Tax=Lentibacillus sediminis TaxID=1940529 RepID=UPI000C1B8B1F|nr:hypothetical protein [Lentibacillus sediminis]
MGLLLSTKDEVAKVYLGDLTDSNKETFRIGRVHFHLSWGFVGFCSYTRNAEEFTKFQWIVFMSGGPLLTLVFCIMLILFIFTGDEYGLLKSIALWLAIYNFFQFFWTAIPIRYPAWLGAYAGLPSDGYTILKVLKSKQHHFIP